MGKRKIYSGKKKKNPNLDARFLFVNSDTT